MTSTAAIPPIFFVTLLSLSSPTAVNEPMQTYLKDGKLTATLVFRDTQGGFAGFTGQTYEVKPDGSWTITRVFNQRKFKPHASGKLSKKQLAELAKVLSKNRIKTLPKQSGSRAQANPLLLTLTYGKTKCVCALPPGTTDPKKLPKGKSGDVGRRMLAVRAFLRETIKPKKKG